MAFIFVMSSDVGSAAHTSRYLKPLILWIRPDTSSEEFEGIQFLIRKLAHISEYAVLALLILRALKISPPPASTQWSWRRAGVALLIASAYAATDEWHQSFVPSRTADPGDVLIDSTGALVGLALVFLRWKLSSRIWPPKATPSSSG